MVWPKVIPLSGVHCIKKKKLSCPILACLALSEKIDKLGLTLMVKYDEETEPISHFIIQLTTEERR